MATCPHCGATLAVGVRFCMTCGRPAPADDAPPAPTTGPVPSFAQSPGPTPSLSQPHAPAASGWAASAMTAPSTAADSPTPPAASSDPYQTRPVPRYTTIPSPEPVSLLGDDLGVRLAPGEELKRTYDVTRMRRALGSIEGRLVVTDTRVLYRAKAKTLFGESTTAREVQIADVSGLAMVTRRGFTPLSLLTLVVGSLIGWVVIGYVGSAATLLSNPFGRSSGAPGWVVALYVALIAVTVILAVIRARSKVVALVVYARGIEASPIALAGSVGTQGAGLMASLTALVGGPLISLARALGFYDATDASDSTEPATMESVYHDLGALILDLQTRGVMGGP